jgi:hypothetical protein
MALVPLLREWHTDPDNFMNVDLELRLKPQHDPKLDQMTDEIIAHYHRRVPGRAELRECLSMLVANLLKVYWSDPHRLLNLPFARAAYTTSRYVPEAISYRKLMDVRRFLLIDQNYAQFQRGFFDTGMGVGRRSKLRATLRLSEYFALSSYPFLLSSNNRNSSDNRTWSSSARNSSSSLFEVERKPVVDPILLRSQETQIEYPETSETNRMRANLQEWNQCLGRQWIDLLQSEDALTAEEVEAGDRPPYPKSLDLGQPTLRRIFANGSFEEGGRFYGGWWQEIPSECRQYITINWEPTRELDYANLLPNFLYSRVGESLEGDAYELEEVYRSKKNRKIVKDAFFALINATNRMAAPNPLPTKANDPTRTLTWKELQGAIKRRHPAIAQYFKSGIGIRLQRTDSDIAEDVMLSMARQNILVLPVHDSFIVSWRHCDRLKAEMIRAYRKKIGIEPTKVRADPSFFDVQLTEGGTDTLCNDERRIDDYVRQVELSPGHEGYLRRRHDIHVIWSS